MLNPFARSMLIDNLTLGFQSRCSVLQFPPPPLFIGYCLMTVHCLMKWPQYLFRDAQKQIFLAPFAWFFSLFCFYGCSLIDDMTPVIVLGSLIANFGGSFFYPFLCVLDYGCSLLDDMTPILVMEWIFLKYDFCCAYLWFVQSNLNSQFIILCQII